MGTRAIASHREGMRFFLAVLLGIATDLTVFYFSFSAGVLWNTAHVVSFMTGAVTTCTLWSFWMRGFVPAEGVARRFSAFVIVALLALFLRGGLLAALVEFLNWSLRIAIIAAVGVSSTVIVFGSRLWLLPQEAVKTEHDGRWRTLIIIIIGYAVLLRLLYSMTFELIHEEGYYWNYAQHLDIGYLDHPPMVGWLIWLFTTVLGHSEFAVRMGAFFCWLITAYYAYKLARAVCGELLALGTLLLVAMLPIFFGVGLLMTPDAPVVACWAGALYYLYRALIEEHRGAWLGVGIFLGLGMLSKYTMALLGAAAVIFILLDRESRKWFFRPEPFLAVALAVLLFSPVIIWNIEHEWASFYFQGPKRLRGSFDFDLPDLIGCVLFLLTPAGFLAAVAIVASRRSILSDNAGSRGKRAYRLLVTSTVIPLSVFVLFSLFRNIKLNWTGPIWLGILPYMAAFMVPNRSGQAGRLPVYATFAWPVTIVALLVLYGATLHYLVLGFPGVPYPKNALGLGMQHFAHQIENIADDLERQTGQKPLIVCMDSDRLAGWIAFYLTKIAGSHNGSEAVRNTTGGHLFGLDSHMYRYWHPIEEHAYRRILLIGRNSSDFLSNLVMRRTKPSGDIEEIELRRNGKVTGHLFYRFVRERRGKAARRAKRLEGPTNR